MKLLFKSPKFWLAVISLGVVVSSHFGLDFDPVETAAAVLPFIAVILGVAWEDAAEKGSTLTRPPR